MVIPNAFHLVMSACVFRTEILSFRAQILTLHRLPKLPIHADTVSHKKRNLKNKQHFETSDCNTAPNTALVRPGIISRSNHLHRSNHCSYIILFDGTRGTYSFYKTNRQKPYTVFHMERCRLSIALRTRYSYLSTFQSPSGAWWRFSYMFASTLHFHHGNKTRFINSNDTFPLATLQNRMLVYGKQNTSCSFVVLRRILGNFCLLCDGSISSRRRLSLAPLARASGLKCPQMHFLHSHHANESPYPSLSNGHLTFMSPQHLFCPRFIHVHQFHTIWICILQFCKISSPPRYTLRTSTLLPLG